MASRPPTSRIGNTATAPVRRNLFHQHLHRRPNANSTSSSTSATVSASVSASTSHPASTAAASTATLANGNSSALDAEIVVRHQNGSYMLDAPAQPTSTDEEPGEEEDTRDREKLEVRLVEMYRNRRRQSSEPELLQALQSSLRRKVASLEDDKWKFEAEKPATG